MVTQVSSSRHAPWEISHESATLREAGLKVTLPRVKILGVLAGREREHLTAEEVYQRLQAAGEDLGLATVYRVLTQFEQVGIALRHHFVGDRAVFELNSGIDHDHMVCVDCGRVEEFKDRTVERRLSEVAAVSGYEPMGHSLVIHGRCPTCASSPRGSSPLV